jgi:lipoprotein-anchoring transpeptidase ErfK/SrfK
MRLKALVALVSAVAIVLGALVISGATSSTTTPPGPAATTTVVLRRTFSPVGPHPSAKPKDVLPPGRGTLVAEVLVRTKMRVSPGGHVLEAIGPRTHFRSPDVLAVVRVSSGWLGVLSEFAGNGRMGWIPESSVVLRRDSYRVRASLSAHTLTVLHRGRVLKRYTIGIGAPGSPTPPGRFAVTDRLITNDPGGPYGCCIIALSATAPHAIPGWTGGNRIAVHATPDTQTIGQPDSHGCMHVTQAQAHWLVYHVPLGTQMTISR